MKFNFKFISIFLFITFLTLGNSPEEKSVATFAKEEKAFYESYRNSDINVAEKILLKYLRLVLDYEKHGIKGIDYHSVLGSTYIRLYLIEEQKNNKETAKKYLDKSLKLHFSGTKMTKAEVDKEKEKIIEFYKGIDLMNSVKWLRDISPE